jgi:hypothetical protein
MDIALVGLAGVVVGAVLSWVGAALRERNGRLHEGRMLIRAEKLNAYGIFSAATKEYIAVLYRVAASKGIDKQTERLAISKAEPLLAQAFRERDRAFEQLRLVGSDELIASARAWVKLVYEMRNYLDQPRVAVDSWALVVADANEARDLFHRQARKELALGAS